MRDLRVSKVTKYRGRLQVKFENCDVTFVISNKWLKKKKIATLMVGQRVIIEGNNPHGDFDVCLAMPNAIKDMIVIG